MKFEKVSLKQFTSDYLKCIYHKEDVDLSEAEANKIIEIWENIKLPTRATVDSAGYDFFIPYEQYFSVDRDVLLPTGIRWVTDDPSTVLLCVPRSGLGFKYGLRLKNSIGVIDSGYWKSDNEGHIMAKIQVDNSFTLEQSKGFMQGIILKYHTVDNDDAQGVRNGGFGSTGM